MKLKLVIFLTLIFSTLGCDTHLESTPPVVEVSTKAADQPDLYKETARYCLVYAKCDADKFDTDFESVSQCSSKLSEQTVRYVMTAADTSDCTRAVGEWYECVSKDSCKAWDQYHSAPANSHGCDLYEQKLQQVCGR